MPTLERQIETVIADMLGLVQEMGRRGLKFDPPIPGMEGIKKEVMPFLFYVMAADRRFDDREASSVSNLLGEAVTAAEIEANWTILGPGVEQQCRAPSPLIRASIDFDRQNGSDFGSKMIRGFEALGLLAAALDDRQTPEEIRRVTEYVEKAKALLPPRPQVSTTASQDQKPSFGRKGLPPAAGASSGNRPQAADLDRLLDELSGLIGLTAVKTEVRNLVNFIRVRRLRESEGLPVANLSLHMVFTGNPGTGKTTVARLVGKIFAALEVLPGGGFLETDRAGLVGQFIGQTEVKTMDILERATGGILFIDEAYALAKSSGQDFGHEAIAVLLKAMEDRRDKLAVIVAGYTEPMRHFIEANPGMKSRFNRFIEFPDYSPAELKAIFEKMARDGGYALTDDAGRALDKLLADLHRRRDRHFGNGRMVRNVFEKAMTAHANRVAAIANPGRTDLIEIHEADILASA